MNARPGDQPRLGADQHRKRWPVRAAEITVAVTGPTGAVGRSVIRALERDARVGRITGMARRPFEPAVRSRNVFEAATVARRPGRLVFMSSVAAYGYYADNPVPLTEDVPARGSPEHYYSAHKAASEALLAEATAGSGLLPALRLVLPDPGVLVQLIHHDDVGTATCAAAMGDGPPGAYNLAAAGEVTIAELARTVGAYAVPAPHVLAVAASQLISALPWVPAEAEWVHAARQPMLMDATRARRDLAWEPRYTAREASISMAGAALY